MDLKPHWSQSVAPILGAITALAAIGALVFTNQQVRLAQQGQISDRFAKAVEQLGQSGPGKVDVRLGAVYSLERIMRDSSDDHPTVVEVLAAFVRVHAPQPAVKPSPSPGRKAGPFDPTPSRPPVDIQAALTVLGGREVDNDRPDRGLDLADTNLFGAVLPKGELGHANLSDANLSDADLSRANLSRATLYNANLSGANLYDADLFNAVLSGATLTKAKLSDANLSNAFLVITDLSRASLYSADLSHANLYGADLSHADLPRANLSGADLSRANLSGADLYDANLYGADLSGADLSRANLSRADLSSANLGSARNLTTEQIRCSRVTTSTQLPPGVTPPAPDMINGLACKD